MATTARDFPYVYVTWITGLLSGEKHCTYSAWIRSRFKIDKRDRNFDLAAWTAEHTDMVIARGQALEAEGWTVYLEAQNDFRLKGKVATLAGKCDLVAVRGDEARVEDAKSGQQRDSDFQQVLIYMLALPMLGFAPRPSATAQAIQGKRLVGSVQYKTHARDVQPEELTPAARTRILQVIARMGDPTPPAKVPSAAECRYCDVTRADCPDRIDSDDQVVEVDAF